MHHGFGSGPSFPAVLYATQDVLARQAAAKASTDANPPHLMSRPPQPAPASFTKSAASPTGVASFAVLGRVASFGEDAAGVLVFAGRLELVVVMVVVLAVKGFTCIVLVAVEGTGGAVLVEVVGPAAVVDVVSGGAVDELEGARLVLGCVVAGAAGVVVLAEEQHSCEPLLVCPLGQST